MHVAITKKLMTKKNQKKLLSASSKVHKNQSKQLVANNRCHHVLLPMTNLINKETLTKNNRQQSNSQIQDASMSLRNRQE